MTAEKRTATRHAVSLPGSIAINGEPRQVTVMNLSLGGALVASEIKFAMGTRCNITFSIPTIDTAIEVGATVRWSDGKATGLQFDGLRARDVWGLNKYFEQLPASP